MNFWYGVIKLRNQPIVHCWTELTDVTLVSEDTYWRLYWETLIINDTYGGDVREIVVLIMEVDKVVDEVTDMEIDK